MAGDTPAWWGTLEEQSTKDGINPEFLRRVGSQESGFRNISSDTSSASGPFQFIKGTWAGLSKRHPELELTNRYDPTQQARAIPRFTRENIDIMEGALGRRVSGGEGYLAHFLGTGDAPRVVKASDDTPIQNVIQPESYSANLSVFKKHTTVGQVRAWAERVSGGVSPYGDSYTPTQRTPNVPVEVPPVEGARLSSADTRPPVPQTRNELRDAEMQRTEAAPSVTDAAFSAVVNESALKWAFHGDSSLVPDPDFRFTPELYKKVTEGVPKEYWGYFDRAHSEAHANFLRREMDKDLEYDRKMDALGLTGTGLKLFGAIVDPVGWAAAAATGPVAGAVKGGRLAVILARAAEGAVAGGAQALPSYVNRPTGTGYDLLYAGAGGAMLGSAFGALARNPAVADLAEEGALIGKKMMQDIEGHVLAGESSVGAAQASPRMAVRSDTYDWLGNEDAVPRSFASWARIDNAGIFGRSDNVAERLLGSHLVEDAAGIRGHVTPIAASEVQKATQLRFETRFFREIGSAFDQWAKDLNLNWAERQSREGEFRQSIADAVRNEDPSVTFHPAVGKAASTWRSLMSDYHDLLVNPGALDGTTRRPVLSPDVPKNDNYFPRLVNREKFQDHVTRLGDRQMGRFIAEAIVGKNPDIADELAQRIGRGWYKRLRDVQAGQELNGGRALFGEDIDGLRHALAEATDLSNDEIGTLLSRFQSQPGEGGVSRTKHRTLMDENFRGVMKDQNGASVEVRLADLFENDALKVFTSYNRQMSGQLAMARLRIENPKWKLNPDSAPQYLVDGVTKRSEWDTLVKQVAAVWDEIDPSTAGVAKRDKSLARLNHVYDAITGTGEVGNPYLRMVRDFNFIRVMNQVGFAQIGDFGQLVGQAGFRATMEGVPAIRALVRDARTGNLNNYVAQEMEYITSGGTDWMRGRFGNRYNEWGESVLGDTGSSMLDKTDAILNKGKRATSALSFMAPVNTLLQRMAGQASMARFINDASGKSSANLNRLRAMGLSEDMVKSIHGELREKVKYIDGDMTVRKVKDFDWQAWNPEARNAFHDALWRMSRRLVQENDLGQTNMFFSSEMGKMLFQFRAFMMSAYTKQFLYGINMRDWETFVAFSSSMALGGAVYAGQSYLQSIGRSDQQKFLDDRLSEKKIAAAAFQRAGFASFLPLGADSVLAMGGMPALFDTRASSLSSKWFGNPTADLMDKALTASGGVLGTITQGSPFTQPDARRLLSVGPFQNFLPWMWVYNSFISSLPEREPRRSRN